MRQLFRELKRRNVYKVAAAYAVAAFIVAQVARLLQPALLLPDWFYRTVVVAEILGFPIALVIAWAFELTPEGVRRTPEVGGPEADGAPAQERRSESRLALKALVGLGLVGAAVAGGWYLIGGGGENPETSEGTVAVLPFQVSGAGAETWRDGMVTVLTTKLDGAAGLRAIADRTVLAAWEESGRADEGASTEEALAVAREVGAEFAVVGSAAQLGEKLQFTAEIHAVASGERVDQVEMAGLPDSVSALTDSLARRTLGVLSGEMEGVESGGLASLNTRSLPALRSYLRGERHFRAGEYAQAVQDYEAAVRRDSTFVLPWGRLNSARWWSAQYEGVFPAIAGAYRMSDRLPWRERRIVRARHLWIVQGRHLAARDSLRRLADAYPDDPSVWYWLGEAVYHGSVPGGWPEAEQAFARAIKLDPGIPQYHHHFVELAFVLHHDSALAAERIASHPPGDHQQMYRRALALVFGNDDTRTAALESVDRLAAPTLLQLANALRHPADGQMEERVLVRILERADVRPSRHRHRLVDNSLERGQLEKALARIEEAKPVRGAAENNEIRRPGCYLALAMTLDMPVPDSLASARLEPSRIDEGAAAPRLMCAGFYLVERNRSDELPALVRRLREAGADQGPGEAKTRAQVNEVRGYRAWREGRRDRAAELWAETDEAGVWGAIWRGDLYRERGKLEEAEGWYLAAWPMPLAHHRLGQLYREMGRPDEAKAAYLRFVAAWEDADPELQPRVEKARARLLALTGEQDETDE